MKKINFFFILTALFAFVAITSCGDDDDDETISPKPRAYFRLTFPEKSYVKYDSTCPFSFEIPKYSFVSNDKNATAEPCFINVNYPTFNGTLHLTYKAVNGDINKFLEQTDELAYKHQVKASRIEEELIKIDSNKVYGLLYDIGGNAASSVNFFITDSTKHFIRGALYFNAVPNTDSIKPVIDFIKKDIYQLINTFKWKN
ncbi:MAG: gliding motility lipoprotein GldD [Bacteroidetes bacterium]|nr:gliding motility lipoprotein GldD [Bacteroidota bacterium]